MDLLRLTDLRWENTSLPPFRPVVVEHARPGVRPGNLTGGEAAPLFSVGSLRPRGPVVIGATLLRREVFGACAPTFLTAAAWAAAGLSFDSPGGVTAFFGGLEEALRGSPLCPEVELRVGEGRGVVLRGLYGPAPWGDEGCLVISLPGETAWVDYRFSPGQVTTASWWLLYPDQVLEPLGRHAAGDWGEGNLLDPVDNERELAAGRVVRSYFSLRSPGELWASVTTDLGRGETRFELLP
ncbi:MAG: hypothetical protein K2X87_08065 [Gemmataceae bacterium]|nr:hypothetical protein [Gemmataceae bacterium]